MKILGINGALQHRQLHQDLIWHVCEQFQVDDTTCIHVDQLEGQLESVDLLVLGVNGPTVLGQIASLIDAAKPIFLVDTSANGLSELVELLSPISYFWLPDLNRDYKRSVGISNVQLQIDLAQQVNGLKNDAFRMFFQEQQNDCGIDNTHDYCGDAIED